MVKLAGLCLAALAFGAGCDMIDHDPKGPIKTKMIPDRTPYVGALLDYSPDTTLIAPEVWVGYMTDSLGMPGEQYDPYRDARVMQTIFPAIWNPPLNAHVINTAHYAHFVPEPEAQADVSITGPLGRPEERRSVLAHLRSGAYREPAPTLAVVPGGRYRLDVRLPGGHAYQAETTVPFPVGGELAPRYDVRLNYFTDGVGVKIEQWDEKKATPWPAFTDGTGAIARLISINTAARRDREMLALMPGERLRFEDRSNWLREGIYAIGDLNHLSMERAHWTWVSMETGSMYKEVCRYVRVSDINEDYHRFYVPEYFEYSAPYDVNDLMEQVIKKRIGAIQDRDTTYYFRASNIQPIATPGVAPRRAIGVFGASASRYLQTTIRLVRDWDPTTWKWKKGIARDLEC